MKTHNSPTEIDLPKLSGAELARSSWAEFIDSYTKVPDLYRDFFNSFRSNSIDFPYTVLTPSHERFIHRTSEKLISDFGTEIYILEKKENTFEIKCYPIKQISYIEFKTALLSSSFKIISLVSNNGPTSSTFIFNAVTDYLFTYFLKTIRLANLLTDVVFPDSEMEKFNHLIDVNYKFMKYAQHSLMGGEKVIHSIFQPEIQQRTLTILGRSSQKTVIPAHMVILTDRELILIQEIVGERKEDRYGGIWDYIPLHKISSLNLSEKNSDYFAFNIQVSGSINIEYLFPVSAKREIQNISNQFKELTNDESISKNY